MVQKQIMKNSPLDIVILGLSITSSWGNGHATTYRSLVKELTAAGHNILFLERDMPWYAGNRDMPVPPFGRTVLYNSLEELKKNFTKKITDADFVIVGSYVPDGIKIGEWVNSITERTAFYDIDTPVTLSKMSSGIYEYITPELISKYSIYLSFTGGPVLKLIEDEYGSPMARALYCSVDPSIYYPEVTERKYDLGYLGTYSDDRQPVLENLMLNAAVKVPDKKFAVVGPMYPETIKWPANVERIYHLSPREHRAFYNSQKFTLNITRADMVKAGYSPSVRLFEAAACGIPLISDYWDGIESILEPGKEILISYSPDDTIGFLNAISDDEAALIGLRARKKILMSHTASKRAEELVKYFYESSLMKKNYAESEITDTGNTDI
jgi:spore maturation protein CgeB